MPVADMSRFTSSITSTKASFFRYLTSAFRHESAPVACIVIFAESSIVRSDLTPSVVMYIFRVSVSVFWGYPKSRISAEVISTLFLCTGYSDCSNYHPGAHTQAQSYSSQLPHRTSRSTPSPAQSTGTGTRTPAPHWHCSS